MLHPKRSLSHSNPDHSFQWRGGAAKLFSFAFLAALLVWSSPQKAEAYDSPNVVLIFADDMGFGDVRSYHSDSKIKTPNLDRLARQGMRFTDAHSASGVCTPSRYALLTGRYCWRTQLKQGVLGGFSPPLLAQGEWTIGHLFQDAGYRTGCFGKWHLGLEWQGDETLDRSYDARNRAQGIDFNLPFLDGPLTHGFDTYFGIAASLDMPPYVFLEQNRTSAQPTSTLAKEDTGGRAGPASPGWRHSAVLSSITDRAIEFIGAPTDERPFFAYVPLNAPHTPHAPSEAFVGKSGVDVYGDFMVEVDHHIGRIISAIDQRADADNTLVIVTSDNGPETNMYARLKKTGHDSSANLLGAKRDNWEGGHRVPFLARWPAFVTEGSTCDTPVGLVDLASTFADILQSKPKPNQAVDSLTILPLLRGDDANYRRSHMLIHHSSAGHFAIRQGDWKLLLHAGSGGNGYAGGRRSGRYIDTPEQSAASRGPVQLYDLRHDRYETENLANVKPDLVDELTDLAVSAVLNGRTTPGSPQSPSDVPWPQLEPWLSRP